MPAVIGDLALMFDDETEIRDTYWKPGPGEVVADIGACVGTYTLPALMEGATVYAVDPSAHYTAAMMQVCVASRLDVYRLHVINKAVAARGGYTEEFRAALGSSTDMTAPADAEFTTLDDLAEEYEWDRLDWVKIDVEGAELAVLEGGMTALAAFHPKLLIEDHTDVYEFVAAMNSEQRCFDLLEHGLGYEVEKVRYEGHRTPDRTFWFCQ
jgi:FkbM family methyltransferase